MGEQTKHVDKIEVFKIQYPLSHSAGAVPECLIYNEDRSTMGQIPLTKEVYELFPDGVFKIYVHGIRTAQGVIDVLQAVEDREW